MDNKTKNIQWLSEYQSDLIKIVGKYKISSHVLSVSEIISEVNNYFLKTDKLLNKEFENQIEFNKFLFAMAKNFTKWTTSGENVKSKQYNIKKDDSIIHLEDDNSIETIFDLVCSTAGEEDEFHKESSKSQRYANIKKWIFEYSDILTLQQKNILPFFLKGKKLREIAEAAGVTHQAVSSMIIDACEVIKSQIKIKNETEFSTLKKGNESIKYLFGPARKKYRKENQYTRTS